MPALLVTLLVFLIVFMIVYTWGVYDALWGGEDPITSPEATIAIAEVIRKAGK